MIGSVVASTGPVEPGEFMSDFKISKLPDDERKRVMIRARRTAFISRFIVLREARRSRAHRKIELMQWEDHETAEGMAERFRRVFQNNGDNMENVDKDIRKALAHADRSINHFLWEYNERSVLNFIDALFDYERSNKLLFGDDEVPKQGGWGLPEELKKANG